nr:thymidine phosphorylase [Clostridia bacterium]
VAACGVPVAKMSGRGLGHTGGTIDKLESIPGMRTELSEAAFKDQVRRIGCAVIGQSAALAPADKRLYALRDVTETVDSMPLIASSIMSKKIAAGCQAIVLDVKTGSGSFLPRLQDSVELAKTMVRIGSLVNRNTVALITDMGQPLGSHIGNALEVKEAIDILTGRAQGPLLEVSVTLGACMLQAAGKSGDLEQAKALLRQKLQSGQGAEMLRRMIEAQGGDPNVVDRTELLPQASLQKDYVAARGGLLTRLDAALLGAASQQLGAGRARKEDVIDPAVGLVMHKRLGDPVRAGEAILTLYANRDADCEIASATLDRALSVGEGPVDVPPLIAARVDAGGIHALA